MTNKTNEVSVTKPKYRVNIFKLFLTVVICGILIMAAYAFFTLPEANISLTSILFLIFIMIPAIINVMRGIVIKVEEDKSEET